ncbi:hypothetical protein [Streptomyces sp. NPDC050145]|uniref:hypothetical protein n=1 Tax=Streptomyces sp. NPDC050145 TaxID=3365602 RepID=UPI003799006B
MRSHAPSAPVPVPHVSRPAALPETHPGRPASDPDACTSSARPSRTDRSSSRRAGAAVPGPRTAPGRRSRARVVVALASAALLSLFALLVPGTAVPADPGPGPGATAAAFSWEGHGPDGSGFHAVLSGHVARGTPPEVPWHHKPGLITSAAGETPAHRLPGRTDAGTEPVPRTARHTHDTAGPRAPPAPPRSDVTPGRA